MSVFTPRTDILPPAQRRLWQELRAAGDDDLLRLHPLGDLRILAPRAALDLLSERSG